MKIQLSAEPNRDYENDWRGRVNIAPVFIDVNSIEDAKIIVTDFIVNNDLGGGNWTGGNVIDNGKVIAHISYNGRVTKM